MAPKFGTSGLRGLVSELTDDLVAAHIRAYLAACETGGTICLGRDLRPSSPRIASAVATAAQAVGVHVIDCGEIATPALALAAGRANAGAVMITGSHIPADRNGLKFYVQGGGEITKTDEAEILSCLGQAAPTVAQSGTASSDPEATDRFVARSLEAFGADALSGCYIGIYEHSAVGRDALGRILRGLGADVIPLGRSETFIPVDTEAVDPQIAAQIRTWVTEHGLDALVSTDGDSDRPLLADETGRIVPGDVMGQITAEYLQADVVVTPISSNSGVVQKGFAEVRRTRIGSPFVIAGMAGAARAVGYEANGGFLLGFAAQGPAGPLDPLLTRDCVLPLVAVLVAARGGPVSARVAKEPAIFTQADRLQEVPTEASRSLVDTLSQSAQARHAFLAPLGVTQTSAPDLTDGLRLPLDGDRTLHIRPSGNAPELRLYVEANTPDAASSLLASGLAQLRKTLNGSQA
ncbi:MAG: phosphomannomutase [Roseobacter sp.]|nr:phosphomannomutase [Roseobacter sp.]